MSFETLNTEVDQQVLSLHRHRFEFWWAWTGGRWRQVDACADCGLKFEAWRFRQICLGVLGELMLAGEKIPTRWTPHFPERVRVSRRALKTNKQRLPRPLAS